MNRPVEGEFQLWNNPVRGCGQLSTETSGSENRLAVRYTCPAAIKDARLHRLKKWQSTNSLPLAWMSHSPSSSLGSIPTSAVGVFPIIEKDEGLAISRWESLPPSAKQLSAKSNIQRSSQLVSGGCSEATTTAKKLGLPKAPRRQKSVESVGDCPI
jgi:hypothetical protein